MRDYRVEVKVKNNFLLNLMEEKCVNVPQLAEASGVGTSSIYGFLNLKEAAMAKNGDWKPAVLKLSKFFNVLPDAMFPPQHLDRGLQNNKSSFEISYDDLPEFISGLNDMEQQVGLAKCLGDAVCKLRDREAEVIRRRFGLGGGEETLDEIAQDFKVHRERIRQIEARALRKLRHPTYSRGLSDFLE